MELQSHEQKLSYKKIYKTDHMKNDSVGIKNMEKR